MIEQEFEKLLAFKSKPDIVHWVEALTFFEDHASELTRQQKDALYYKCERYRQYFNTNRTGIRIVDGSKTPTFYRGLNIQREDISYSIFRNYK